MNRNTALSQLKEYSDIDNMEDVEEVYEIEDEEDLDILEEQLRDEGATLEEADDNEGIQTADFIFTEHKGSVFCVALSPKDNIAASGGEDDLAYVWDTEKGFLLFTCAGHKDSVTNVAFSYDGCYLATADMSGYCQAWDVSTKLKVWEFETDDVNWMTWHPKSHVLLAGTCSGEVWLWLIPHGNTKSLSHAGISTECSSLLSDGHHLCIGYDNGTVRVLALKSEQTLHTFNSHTQKVTSLSSHPDNVLLLSGSVDGTAALYNTSTGKTIASLNCAFTGETELEQDDEFSNTVEVVSFCPTVTNTILAVTATLSGLITIWDIPTETSRHHIVQGCGTSAVRWHPKQPYFFAAGLDGVLRIYDTLSAEQKGKCVGHTESILSCDVSKDGSKVITSSDDGTVRVFKIENVIS